MLICNPRHVATQRRNSAGSIDAAIANKPKPLQEYRGGKAAAMGALVGLVMKSGRGLNPKLVQERLRAKLA